MTCQIIHNAQHYPYHYRHDFEQWLFQSPEHSQSQAQGTAFDTFLWINEDSQNVEARLTMFYISDNQAISPLKATFGGLSCAEDIPTESIEQFIQTIQQRVQGNIRITLNYWEKADLRIRAALQNCGFSAVLTETNQYIEITQKSFRQVAHRSLLRHVKKCEALGYTFEQGTVADLPHYHQLLVQARHRKGFPVSLTLPEIQKLFLTFPQYFQLFLVKQSNQILAATITVKISERVLYYFLPADVLLPHSPMSFLIKNLYEYAQNQGFSTIDLGISSLNGVLNEGLFTFKNRCGAKVNQKVTYEVI